MPAKSKNAALHHGYESAPAPIAPVHSDTNYFAFHHAASKSHFSFGSNPRPELRLSPVTPVILQEALRFQ